MHVEPEMEAFLLRLVPELSTYWQGATDKEIEEIEKFAGQPLPLFYRWFLMKMGRSMGPLTNPKRDLSATSVISWHQKGENPDTSLFLFGREADPIMPLYILYDLAKPLRDDALVVNREVGGHGENFEFETFREMLAWGTIQRFGIPAFPQQLEGVFVLENADLSPELTTLLDSLGFKCPIQTGSYCGIYERSDATIVCLGSPEPMLDNMIFLSFSMGAENPRIIGKILGEITSEPSFEIKVSKMEWNPPLSD